MNPKSALTGRWGWVQVDVLPLERFNAVWRPNEPERLKPVYVERVTIREALRGDLLPSLFGIVQLIEPTFGVRPGPVTAWMCSSGSSSSHSMLAICIEGKAMRRWTAERFMVGRTYAVSS